MEQFFVGRHLTNRLGFIDVSGEKQKTHEILSTMLGLKGSNLQPETIASTLTGGERQGIAIGRAMHFNSEIVVLDEPTTALSSRAVEKVLLFVGKIKKNGKSCRYISHNVSHVFSIAERFVIVDKGKIVKELSKDQTCLEDLMKIMIHVADSNMQHC